MNEIEKQIKEEQKAIAKLEKASIAPFVKAALIKDHEIVIEQLKQKNDITGNRNWS